MRVHGLSQSSTGSWHAQLKDHGQWFTVEGEVQLDEGTVMSVGQLLELISQSQGKYLRLGEGEFLLLSENLQKQLNSLYSVPFRTRRTERHAAPVPAGGIPVDGSPEQLGSRRFAG